MRNFIDIIEARRIKSAPVPVFDAETTKTKLTTLAQKLSGRPFDVELDNGAAKQLVRAVQEDVARHNADMEQEEEEYRTTIDESELYLDHFATVYYGMAQHTFDMVWPEVRQLTLDYQKRHGERLDDEAGYRHDMHYIESSDWLDAMDIQRRYADRLDSATKIRRPYQIADLVTTLEGFASDWTDVYSTEQGDEPVLTERMTKGLSLVIPLLILVVDKI